jgi:putative membrane protein
VGQAAGHEGVRHHSAARRRHESPRCQGLYNGFLAAGLIWGIWLGEAGDPVKLFFLTCVAVAGLYGAATASRKILFVQTIPAVVAIVAVWLA